jgi:hypothetical protein
MEAIARELHEQTQNQKNETEPLIAEAASDLTKQSFNGMLDAVQIRFHSGNYALGLPRAEDQVTRTGDLDDDADLV